MRLTRAVRIMGREASAYESFLKLEDEQLYDLAVSLCEPDAIRRTNLIEFSDLTSVTHKITSEVSNLGRDGWPGHIPDQPGNHECRGFVFLGFLRRGMPVQHTDAKLNAGDKTIGLTRMDSDKESSTLALLLLDTVWRRCMPSERESIPRPFWLGDKGKDGKDLPAKGKPPGDLFWQEFLGIRGSNLNPDWELFLSRCELAESVKASHLWRDGRSEGDSKWSEERAILAKLCSRLAFSSLSAAWLPEGTCAGSSGGAGLEIGSGPYQIQFEFQERVLKSQEQSRRIQGLRNRASRSYEESAWAERGRTNTVYPGQESGVRDRDLERLALVPETYLGLLDPALDNVDHQARRSRKIERSLSSVKPDRDDESANSWTVHQPVGTVFLLLGLLGFTTGTYSLASGNILTHWATAIISVAVGLTLVALGVWLIYSERSPSRGLGPSSSPGRKAQAFLGYFGALVSLVGIVALIGENSLWPSILALLAGLGICLLSGRFPRPVFWLATLISMVVGASLLVPEMASKISPLFEPWGWGEALGLALEVNEENPAPDPSVIRGLVTLLVSAFLLSLDLSFIGSGRRQETVALPTWSGSSDWNVYEIRTPAEFTVWQGIIARPSRRNRGWRTRTAVEIGRKAHFWWSDPSDRGHVPEPVFDRPQLLLIELRARLSSTITSLGSALSFATAAILLSVALIQIGGGQAKWEALQQAGGDAVITVLLLLPTVLGALLIRPGEDPIAGQLLRLDRVLVFLGAVFPAGLAAALVLIFGWPALDGAEPASQETLLWAIWILLAIPALVVALTLFLSWLDSRKIDRPEPFNRQQSLPASEPRRRNIDYPAPLPPLARLWGRMFARRSLLRLAPRRSLLRSKVTTTYSLVLPAEGSRVYTPASPTILCLLPPGQDREMDDSDWERLRVRLSRLGNGDEPVGTQSQLATNIIGWDPSAALSLVAPRVLTTGCLPDYLSTEDSWDGSDEKFLTTLLRLQRANSRPNRRKSVGGGGGLVMAALPNPAYLLDQVRSFADLFDRDPGVLPWGVLPLIRWRPNFWPWRAGRIEEFERLLGIDRAPSVERQTGSAAPEVALLGLSTGSLPLGERTEHPILDLPERSRKTSRDLDRLLGILDRAALDFDALLLLDLNVLREDPDQLNVVNDRWSSAVLSARAAELARQAERGPGVHVWPSSFEPPLAGESVFPARPGLHGDRIQLGHRIILGGRFRTWWLLRFLRRLLFTRWNREIPVGIVTGEGGRPKSNRGLRPRAMDWGVWVREIPRALESRPPLPRETSPMYVGQYCVEDVTKVNDQAKDREGDQPDEDPLKVVLMSGNIGAGKSWMMHRLRAHLARYRQEEWDAVRVDSANNFFFQNVVAFEGNSMDARTSSYHLDPGLGPLALAYQDLVQRSYLIESWDVLQSAIGNKRTNQKGVFVEYWPAFCAWVMAPVFLKQEYEPSPSDSPMIRRTEKRLIDLAEGLERWNREVLASLDEEFEWSMVHLAPENKSELEQRIRSRARRNEEVDPSDLKKIEKKLRDLYVKRMMRSGGVRKKGERKKVWPHGAVAADERARKRPNRVIKRNAPGPQWPEKRILKANANPKPEGEELKVMLDELIDLL